MFRGVAGGHFGEDEGWEGAKGGGNAPLEDQRHSWQRPEGNKTHRSGKKTQGQNRAKHTQEPPQNKPSLHGYLPSEPGPSASQRFHCLHLTAGDPPPRLSDIKQIQPRERTMSAPGRPVESHRNNSYTINTVTGNQKSLLRGLFQKEKVPETTLCPKKKGGK